METFYHGTSVLFDKFDLSHALEGDGKAKFGFGTYVTEVYTSAAHYAYNKKRPERITICSLPGLCISLSLNGQRKHLVSRCLMRLKVPVNFSVNM